MTSFAKKFLAELALYVVGYITYVALKVLGQITLRLGRAVFSR